MKLKDGSYYWLLWKHRPGVNQEWMVALFVEHAGWQIPGMLYSTDQKDPHITKVGAEVIREADLGGRMMFDVKISAEGNSTRLEPAATLREALDRLAIYLDNWTHDGHTLGLDSVEIAIERKAV